jgi:small subunit ribosomal protein S4
MGRYRSPVGKKSRNLGTNLNETPKLDALLKRRPTASGQHGAANKKLSEFAIQLKEKQRLKFRYGLRENQLRKYYDVATRKQGNTGTILLQMLEARLDNVIFRAGFAASRRQARQICAHGHLLVNGHRVTIPSILLKVGDIVTVRPSSAPFISALSALVAASQPQSCGWVVVSPENLAVRVERKPDREEMDTTVREQLIIEYYSR